LQDSTNTRWATGDVDEAIEKAIEQYSRQNPFAAITTVTLPADGREIDISAVSGLLRVEKVWWDYDVSTPGYPPNWRQFEVWPGKLLYINDPSQPTSADVVRLWYTKAQTLNGLDSATATTIPAEDITYIITGAAGFCAQSRAIELAESLNVDREVVKHLEAWAKEQMKNFRYGGRQKQPAWQRYSYSYAQNDIDEAIRWALHRYSQINPDTTITSITLTADGREVDISSITDYLQIERVWWDYDSSDPDHPPNWRDFELWPGNILFVKDSDEPSSGDVVRIWYNRLQAINGLDGASVTTLPTDDETLIVIGASGYCAQERVQESEGSRIPTRLREWADLRRKEFEANLKQLARRLGARESGIAPGPSLDRWDDQQSGWC
jgi:hypothetical protein